MKILINERLSEHRCKTPEGYLICTDAILARTGKQTYRKNEIFKDSDDETEIEVDRTEDEVFSPQTLASFENKPVTVEHPDEDVNVHNYKEYAVGFVRDVHRGVVNGQPVILGNLVITDEKTIQEIENGEHTDLSCGYDCDIADEANPCQRNIRGNHVALCECGRAGIARIVDSANDGIKDESAFVIYNVRNHKYWSVSRKEWVNEEDEAITIFAKADYAWDYAKTNLSKSDARVMKYFDSIKDSVDNSMCDARIKVANLTNGYAIVPASKWRKFGLNSEVERFTTNLDEARYIRSSLERNDGISFVIVDVTQRRTTDSVKDKKYKSEDNEMKDYVIKDSKERLFTVKHEQNGVMYIHKVRASSIEDAISKTKDEIHDSLKDDVARILKPLGLAYTLRNVLFAWDGVLIHSFEFGTAKDAKLAYDTLKSELHGTYKFNVVQKSVQFSEPYDVKLKEKMLNDIKSAGGKDVKLHGTEFGNRIASFSFRVSNEDDLQNIASKLSKMKNYSKVKYDESFGGTHYVSGLYDYSDLYRLIHDSAKLRKFRNH